MDVKKTVRKMSAFLAGGLLLGTTVMGALAYDLSNYPAPFVKDGYFVGKIVVGEKAMPSDVIGATDIAAGLQAAAVTPVETEGTASTESFTNGYLFKESKELILGENMYYVNPLVDDTELPDVLKSLTVTNDHGTEFEYEQEIIPGDNAQAVSADVTAYSDISDVQETPVVYYDIGNNDFYQILIDFKDQWSATDFDDSESIELFGQMYTFDPNNANDDDYLTLFGTESEVYIEKGQKATVKYDGVDYTIEVLGGNSDDNTCIVRVGTETKTMEQGDSKTVGGLPIYVKDVFISNVGGDNVAAQLFIGSNKIEIEYHPANGEVKLNGKVLDEVTVAVDRDAGGNNWEDVNSLNFTVKPREGADETEYLLPGKEYVDPLFKSFKFHFTGADDLEKGKEELGFLRTSKKVNVVFTPEGGEEYSLPVVDDEDLAENFLGDATLLNVTEDLIFIYNDRSDMDAIVTHVLQVTRIKDGDNTGSADFEVKVDDLTFGKTYKVTKCEELSSEIPLYPEGGATEDMINLTTDDDCVGADAAGELDLYTKAGVNVTMDLSDPSNVTFTVDEDYQGDADATTAIPDFLVVGTWDGTDKEYDISLWDSQGLAALDDDDNVDYYLSEFGTYIAEETDDSGAYVKMYIPAEEVTYDMWLAPVGSKVVVIGGAEGGAYTIHPFTVGAAILDKDAMSMIGTTPLIVVGGPFVNTVAAQLMGNPTADVINTMFQAGTAKIKLYPAQNALLVAGYNAQDTLGASYVLAQYSKYALTGNEVEVLVPSLSSISVKTVGQ